MCACFSRSEQIVSGMCLSQCGLPMRFLGHDNLQSTIIIQEPHVIGTSLIKVLHCSGVSVSVSVDDFIL